MMFITIILLKAVCNYDSVLLGIPFSKSNSFVLLFTSSNLLQQANLCVSV